MCYWHFQQHHPQLSPPLLVQLLYICGPLPTPNRLYTWVGQVKRGLLTKIISPYSGCHKVWSALSEYFWSLNKGRMWWYNILGDNDGGLSHNLQFDRITAGSIWLTVKLVAPKRENYEPIWTFKQTEWRKFIDYFGLSIEADPSKVSKNNIYVVCIESIPSTSSGNPHVASQQLDTYFSLETPKLRLYQFTKVACW